MDNETTPKPITLAQAEKLREHRRLRMQALCLHRCPKVMKALEQVLGGNEIASHIVRCTICGKEIDLTPMTDAQISKAFLQMQAAFDLVKLLNNGSDTDKRVVEEIVGPTIQRGYFIPGLYSLARDNKWPAEGSEEQSIDNVLFTNWRFTDALKAILGTIEPEEALESDE